MSPTVRNNPELQRFEMHDGGELVAFLQYRLHGQLIDLLHTETLPGKQGHGYGSQLVGQALNEIRGRGWQVRPYCPFVRSYLAEHGELRDLVPDELRARFGLDGDDG